MELTPQQKENIEFARITAKVYQETSNLIRQERIRQWKLYGENRHTGFEWLCLLQKQLGQLASALFGNFVKNDPPCEEVLKQAVQVAAVAHANVEDLLRFKRANPEVWNRATFKEQNPGEIV